MAFLDSFTGTAGTKLNTRTGWAQIGSGYGPCIPEINASNQLKAAADTGDVPVVGQDSGNANHYVQANVYSGFQFTSGAMYPQLIVRATTRGDSFGAAYSAGAGAWYLISNNNSVAVSAVRAFVSGDLVRIEAEGSNIRVLVNGTKVIDYTATDRLTNTNVGVLIAGTASADPVLDNYESGLISAAPAATAAFNTRTIDGQNVTYTFTTANTPTSGTMTLTATGGGAVTIGPSNLTLGTNTASITFTGVVPGTYSESGTITGAGGGGAITGLGTLSIASIGGNPPDTGEPQPSTVTGVSVTPSTATGSTTFSATVNGTNSPSQSVTWSASAGTINSSGVFTAPTATGSTQTITVTATSVQDNTKSGTATVTIAAVVTTVSSVTVSPSTATGSTTFSATVNGTNSPSQAVTWSTTGGTITAGGVFTAPTAINTDQVIVVKATSVFDPTKYGTATVTIAAVPNAVPPSFSSSKKGRSRRKGRR